MNKYFLGFLLLTVSTVASAETLSTKPAVIVCRSRECKPAYELTTREYLYNKLVSLFENNLNRKVAFCEADPLVRVCRSESLDFPVQADATGSIAHLPFAKIIDVKVADNQKSLDFIWDYHVAVGNTYPECQASLGQLFVSSPDKITLVNSGFECKFTSSGITHLNLNYQIDYIDLDYGILGASYTVGAGEVSRGGNMGYVLMRFAEPANQNNEKSKDCDCACDDHLVPPCQCEPTTIVQEKVVTEYEVAPIEVIVKTKAPIETTQKQQVKINGVMVSDVPVVVDNFQIMTE